jgi:lipopolysaccharide transport system ATP-binding protein
LNPVSFNLPINQLALGSYFISLDLSLPWIEYLDRVESCLYFEVARPPHDEATQVLSQSWGFGCIDFQLEFV